MFSGLNLLEHIDKNKGFLNVMALIVAIQVLLTYVGGRILRTTPLNLHEWSVVVLFGLSIIVVDLLRKSVCQIAGEKIKSQPLKRDYKKIGVMTVWNPARV